MCTNVEKTIVELLERVCAFCMEIYWHELKSRGFLAACTNEYISRDLYIQRPPYQLQKGANRCNLPINAADIENITTLIIAKQLQIALEQDRSNFYTVSKFYRMTNRTAEKESPAYEADIQHYYQTAREFRKYLGAEREQAEMENRSSGNPDDTNGKRQVYTLPDLYFLKLCMEGKLALLKSLLARKQPCAITADGYRLLDEAIREIQNAGREIRDAKMYVSGCMAIQKLEQANQFIFCARVAEEMIANDIPENTPFSARFPITLGRFPFLPSGLKESPAKEQHTGKPRLRDRRFVSARYNTVYTENDFRLAFDRREDEAEWLEEKAILSRYIQEEVGLTSTAFLKMVGFYGRAWSDKDFQAARDFFKERYPVVEHYQPIFTDCEEAMKQKVLYTRLRFQEFMQPHTPEGVLSDRICYSPLKYIHDGRKQELRKTSQSVP